MSGILALLAPYCSGIVVTDKKTGEIIPNNEVRDYARKKEEAKKVAEAEEQARYAREVEESKKLSEEFIKEAARKKVASGLIDFVVHEGKMYASAFAESEKSEFLKNNQISVVDMGTGRVEWLLKTDDLISLITMCNEYLVAVTYCDNEWKLVYFDVKNEYQKREINLNQMLGREFITERIDSVLYDEKTNRILITTYENEIIILQ